MATNKTRVDKLESRSPDPQDAELVDVTWMLDTIHAAYGSPPETERHFITRAAYDEIFRKLNAVYGPGSPFREQKEKEDPRRFTAGDDDEEDQDPASQAEKFTRMGDKIYPPGYQGE